VEEIHLSPAEAARLSGQLKEVHATDLKLQKEVKESTVGSRRRSWSYGRRPRNA